MYGINLIVLSEGFYWHLLGRTFIWRYLHSARVVLVCKTWYRQKTGEQLWHLSRDLVQVSHHAQTVALTVTWIFFHEKLAFIFIIFFSNFYFGFILWDQYLILQGKHRRRLMFQYVRLLEPPARGENAIPGGALKVSPCQGHPENICGGSTESPRRYHVS